MRDAITRLTRDVLRLRAVRRQLAERDELVAKDDRAKALVEPSKALIARLDDLEGRLHNPKAEITYDVLAQRGGTKLYSRLAPLMDWSSGGEGAPTEGMRQVFAAQQQELPGYEAEMAALFGKDLAALNQQAAQLGVPGIYPGGEVGAAPPHPPARHERRPVEPRTLKRPGHFTKGQLMNAKKMIGSLAVLAVVAVPVGLMAKDNPMVGGAPMSMQKNIVENAMNSKDHTTLVAAVKAAGLVDTLRARARSPSSRRPTSFAEAAGRHRRHPAQAREQGAADAGADLSRGRRQGRFEGARQDDQGGRRHGDPEDRRRAAR